MKRHSGAIHRAAAIGTASVTLVALAACSTPADEGDGSSTPSGTLQIAYQGPPEGVTDPIANLVDALIASDGQQLDPDLRADFEAADDDAARLRVVIDQVASLTDISAPAWASITPEQLREAGAFLVW